MLLTKDQLSLRTNKVLRFVCTVIRTAEIYAWTILLIEGIDWFKLRKEEGNKSVMQKNKSFAYAQIQYKLPIKFMASLCTCISIMGVAVRKYNQQSFKNTCMKFYVHVSVVYTHEVRSQRKIHLGANEIMFRVIGDYNGDVRILVKSNLCTFPHSF